MGVDQSRRHSLRDWQMDPVVVYETDRWKVNDGVLDEGTRISVFEAKNNDEQKGSLERLAKHLRTLRHPCIVKHLLSCKRRGQLHLVTEQVVPLEILLCEQKPSVVETIAGLYNILQALQFLHSTCGLQHNGVCTSSVFVCANGSWKLAGFEWTKEVNREKANSIHQDDVYAFAQFALHLLADREELVSIPGGVEFCQRLEVECLGSPAQRPTCITLSSDPIFKNDFLDIRSFLQNLVLKLPDEKEKFFRTLTSRLCELNPELIARHLSHLLLCRLVFLDENAVTSMLPSLLQPQTTDEPAKNLPNSLRPLLPVQLYEKYIIPQLLSIFCVRSRHVRIVLLTHFRHYVRLFTKDELSSVVLPQVLLGVRDTNDEIVSATLEALAKLVTLLGANVVVGGSQQKLFTEATPSSKINDKMSMPDSFISTAKKNKTFQDKRVVTPTQPLTILSSNKTPVDDSISQVQVLERSSPDGGESLDDDDNNAWFDWDTDSNVQQQQQSSILSNKTVVSKTSLLSSSSSAAAASEAISKVRNSVVVTGLGEEFDIMALNIAVKPSVTVRSPEDDFFLDMEPTIVPTKIAEENVALKSTSGSTNIKENRNSCAMLEIFANEESGWDETDLPLDWTD